METKTKVLSATYEILYIDNHFAKLNKVGSNFCIYEKVDNLPKGINVGDTIEKWYNKIANSYSYEIKRKKSLENCKSYVIAQWNILKRGHCSTVDFIYVVLAQIFFCVAPYKMIDYMIKKYLREKLK